MGWLSLPKLICVTISLKSLMQNFSLRKTNTVHPRHRDHFEAIRCYSSSGLWYEDGGGWFLSRMKIKRTWGVAMSSCSKHSLLPVWNYILCHYLSAGNRHKSRVEGFHCLWRCSSWWGLNWRVRGLVTTNEPLKRYNVMRGTPDYNERSLILENRYGNLDCWGPDCEIV